jgi:hypothetical protein
LKSDEDAKTWIAENGFSWNLAIRDVPSMGIAGGSGGGGGDSLVTGDTRRRVIYFGLGFSGHAERVRLVQILKTFGGQLTICHRLEATYKSDGGPSAESRPKALPVGDERSLIYWERVSASALERLQACETSKKASSLQGVKKPLFQ